MGRDADISPVGEAMVWVSRIMAIGLTMFLPGVAGNWADARLGTRFLGPGGWVIGMAAALLALSRLTTQRGARRR